MVEATKVRDGIIPTILPLEVVLETGVGVILGPEGEGVPNSPFRTLSPSTKRNEDIGQPTNTTHSVVSPNFKQVTYVKALAIPPVRTSSSNKNIKIHLLQDLPTF